MLPSTSCSCERSISSLRHLKDYTQSTMESDRLNDLASMYICRDIYINPSFVVKKLFWPTLIEGPTLGLWADLEKFEI